ncbi:MAG: metallophosphoesterase [Eubacterium sp.]|nr:metallophosphoesterase [Eubacterium sp.]
MIRKILIVSDSHGKTANVKIAIDREYPDMLIHLGDIEDDPDIVCDWLNEAARVWNASGKTDSERIGLPVPAVFIQGNCDRYSKDGLRKSAVFDLNDHRFFCTHGHVQGVSYDLNNLMYTAMENDCDIAMYGHTHIPFDDEFSAFGDVASSVRILNPGSISLPRGGSNKSYMIMTFDDNGDYEVELKGL